LRSQLGLESDHGMSLVVNRLRKQHAVRSRKKGRQTFYSISPSWIKRNKKLAQTLVSIGKAFAESSHDRFAREKQDTMIDFDKMMQDKLSEADSVIRKTSQRDPLARRKLLLVMEFSRKLVSDRLDMFELGRRRSYVVLAMCLMKRKGDEKSAKLFANEYAREMKLLVRGHLANIMRGIELWNGLEQTFRELGERLDGPSWSTFEEFIDALCTFNMGGVAHEALDEEPIHKL
jgi:hypothetical protein